MGLNICKRIAKSLNGDLQCLDDQSEGAQFELVLRLYPVKDT